MNGVIIGRFQCQYLHEGHRKLIEKVMEMHDEVTLLLGVSPLKSTSRNPLTYEQRRAMVKELYPSVTCKPIIDVKGNEAWSAQVDKVIGEKAIIYGGRDSFIPYYTGTNVVRELDIKYDGSATAERAKVDPYYSETEDFRAGTIFGAKNQWVNPVPCVDVAIMDHGKVLLGRKKGSTNFQFIGGFVDANDTWEEAAFREVKEETGLKVVNLRYINSCVVENDWRYKGEEKNITTTFFAAEYTKGTAEAMDDIEEVKWFYLQAPIPIVESHKGMLQTLRGVYRV